jgi:hypothetical protein
MSFSCRRPGHSALMLVLVLTLPSFGVPGAPQATNGGQLLLIAGDAGDAGVADGPTQVARLMALAGITVDDRGNVYVTDGNAIRKITPGGVVTMFAGNVNFPLFPSITAGCGAKASSCTAWAETQWGPPA